jgi:hypothetical protein
VPISRAKKWQLGLFFLGLIMSLKKSLKRCGRDGQVVMEYFILLAVIALLTVLATSRFFGDTKLKVEGFTNAAATAMNLLQ